MLFGLSEVLFHQLVWQLWKFDSLTGSLLGSAIFILALVLSGTLSQYHPSEIKLPELVNEAVAIPTNAWHCVRHLHRLQPLVRVIVGAVSQPQPSQCSPAISFFY